jgi:hypothetical protein
MEYKIQYPGLQDSLLHLKIQVIQSIDYCKAILPDHVSTPEDIFYYCKNRTTYKADGGNELFQTAETLLENNVHGIPGAGDCDCFTILLLACLAARGYKNIGIVLVGRSPKNAVHIYVYVKEGNRTEFLDMTNNSYNYERFYPFKQLIPFKVTPIKVIFNQ